MVILLLQVNKKINSTYRTTEGALRFSDCRLIDGCSIVSPVIELNLGNTRNILDSYNYVYIEDFSRFYFINNWTFNNGLWILSLNVDVLASFKEDIGLTNKYILRACSQYNGNIIDSKYPIVATVDNSEELCDEDVYDVTLERTLSDYFNRNYENGYFIIGVVGNNGTGVTYYSLRSADFKRLVNSLMAFSPTDMPDVSAGIAKALANPIQYVTTCYWTPYARYDREQQLSIKFGNYTIQVYGFEITNSKLLNEYSTTIDLPKHPQRTRGHYLDLSPYSRYSLIFNPFGTFTLDTVKICNSSEITLDWFIDYSTGQGDLRVFNDEGDLLEHSVAMFGIPIQLSQITVDTLGGIGSLIGGGLGVVGGIVSGNVVGGMMSAASGITSAIQSMQPQATSKGASGSFISFAYRPRVYGSFSLIAEEDFDNLGRPLCEIKKINTLSGFIMCRDGENKVGRGATDQEKDLISQFLTEGFYYE